MRKGSKHSIESRKKLSIYRRGKKASEETKIKMREFISKALKGRVFTAEWKKNLKIGAKNRKSHPLSDEHKKKISEKHKGKKFTPEQRAKLCGKNHPNWKGGLTSLTRKIRNSLEYKLWRKAVLQRDDYSCIWCGRTINLHVDHIKPFALYPELRFAIDNGRTLCFDCHKTTPTYGGNKK